MAKTAGTTHLEKLQSVLVPALQPYASRIELFGSTSRGESDAKSDLDVLVQLRAPEHRPLVGLRWFALEQELADQLGRPVELVTWRALSRYIRPHVEVNRVLLYEEE